MPSARLWTRSFGFRVTACFAVGALFSGAVAPSALAAMTTASSDNGQPLPPSSPPRHGGERPVAASPAVPASGTTPPAETEQLPALWSPREVALLDVPVGDAGQALRLFDGDVRTELAAMPGTRRAVRIDLGDAPPLLALGLVGTGRARVSVFVDGPGGRRSLDGLSQRAIGLRPDGWVSLSLPAPERASALVLEWASGAAEPAALAEVAVWALGPARDAAVEVPAADRLLTGLPANALSAPASPQSASVVRVTGAGPQGARFTFRLERDPALLGRTFLLYELERLAHWTGATRSINGHVARGGYRADVRGTGGVQVEEIAPAWLRRGDNSVAFQPTTAEDGLGYVVHNVRLVAVPRTASALSQDGHQRATPTTALPASPSAQPAYLAFAIERAGEGTLIVSARGPDRRHRADIRIDLGGRAPGWQSVPLGGALAAGSELRIAVHGRGESRARVGETRVLSYPALSADGALELAYPLHGECFDHQVYVRGFLRPAPPSGRASLSLSIAGEARPGAVDADGSFAVLAREPDAARGKPWQIDLEVAAADGGRWRRAIPIDACAEAPPPRVVGASPPVEDAGAPYGAVVSPRGQRTLSFGGATLDVPAGAVDRDVRITMRTLAPEGLPPLGRLMTNVTPGGGAFRLGPHGIAFGKPVRLALPVEPARLPRGMGLGDVKIFYYDEAHGRWTAIRDRPSGREHVEAMTGHFTDFIAATMAIPDHPDAQLFNANTLKGIKLADPAAGITLIEPPQADPSGAAVLHYPIETPPGRNGIQPNLTLGYDSERAATSGWLGVGWDLGLSSIEIDTRFGVPRYDGADTYLLDGATLAPLGGNLYRRRVEGAFERIERKGTGPADTFWEVTDKNGTKRTYGANAGGGANSRLSDPRPDQPGNIFRWLLERIEDPFGNFMTVSYVADTFSNGDTFTQVYPRQIDYTGGPSLAPAYHVDFKLDDGGTRPDVTVSGRAGFPVATRRRLVEIDVRVGSTPVRSYAFDYDDAHAADSFGKSLLSAVSLRSNPDDPGSELYRHTFEYFKAPAADALFAPPTVWGGLQQPDGSPRADDGLNHANDQLFGASGSVGIGLFDFFSATVNGGGDSGETAPDLVLVDANGDGMPDQIDRGGNLSLNSIFGPDAQHFAGALFPGVGTVGHTGRSGWTAGGSLSALEGLFGVGASYSQHTAEDDQLLADMNGDGFPDIVTLDSGAVNVRLNNGLQQFAAPQPWSSFSLGGVAFSRQDRWGQAGQAGAFFPADPLIRWVAPFAGTVTIDSTLAKVRSGGDGVRADLFVNGEAAPRWTCAFTGADLDPCAQSLTLAVAAGDRVYTKVTALGDPAFDELTASLNIVYQTNSAQVAEVDPTGAPLYRFNQGDDFRLAGLPSVPWVASADGDVLVTACFTKGATPDDVIATAIQRRGASGAVVAQIDLPVAADATGGFCIPALQQPLHVQADDTIALQVTSSSPIDPARVSWPAAVAYQSYCRVEPRTRTPVCAPPVCNGGFCTIGPGDPLRDFPFPEGFVHAPVDVFVPAYQWTAHTPAPMQSFVAAADGTPDLTWTVTTTGPRVRLLVQGVNRLLAKTELDGMNPTAHLHVSPDVRAGEQLFFTAFFPDGEPVPLTVSIGVPQVDGTTAPANVLFPDPRLDNNGALAQARDPMSGGYHRWFYGDWNGARPFTEADIRVSADPRSTDSFLFVTPAPLGLPARPDLGPVPMWIGRGAGELLAAGRVNPGFTTAGAATGRGDGVNALRVSDTWNLDLQATAVGIEAAVNAGDSTTDVDLFDVNGDRFPDSVTAGGVQLNDGTGSFGPRQPLDSGFGDLRSTKNASLRFGVDLGVVGQLINLANTRSESSKTVSTSAASASTDYGVNSTRVDFIDVNGDGLLDHVAQSPGDAGISVRLNLGHGFSRPVLWRAAGWQRGEIPASFLTFTSGGIASDVISGALGLVPGHATSTNALRFGDTQTNNLSVGVPGQTFGAGGGPTASLTRRIVDLIDLNGDGLPDQVMRAPDEDRRVFRVKMNQGDHFGPETQLSIPDWTVRVDDRLPAEDLLSAPDGVGYSTMAGWTASAHFQFCFILCVGGSAFYSRDNGGTNMEFEDIDGDGKPDQVLKIAGDPNVYVKLNQTGKTNLLKTVHRPLGATIAIDYARVGNHVDLAASPKVDMPSNLWAMVSTAVSSGQAESQPGPLRETVDYSTFGPGRADGFYDRRERDSFGFADVKTVFPEEGSSVANQYANQDYYQKGLLTSTTFNQVDATGQALQRLRYTYVDPSGSPLPDPVADALTGTFFPAPRDTETDVMEADPAGRAKRHLETRRYDTAGNLTDVIDVGDADFGDPSDDFNYHIDYVHPDPAGLITRASAVAARSGQSASAGALLRRRTATYLATGKPDTITDTIAGGKDPATGAPRTEGSPALSTVTLGYDAFGNVVAATTPEGHASSYEYDATARTYRTKTTDLSFGYVSTADYDLRFGTPRVQVDVDGAREELDHDDFGRVVRVFGPKDFDGGGARTTPSLTFDYSEQPHAPGAPESLPASATSSHKNGAPPEMSRPGDPIPDRLPIRTIAFSDGLGRNIQTKQDITRDDGQGNVVAGMSVSGALAFDARGRLFQQGQPTFQPGASPGFVAGRTPLQPTSFAYDVLSRQRQVSRPDSSSVDAAAHGNQAVTTTSFQLGTLDGKLFVLQLVRDARGEVKNVYRSVRQEVVAHDEVNRIGGVDGVHLTTRYAYDPLSQLTSVTDALGNVTSASYDSVGNMVALTSPDAGRTERRYDRSGHMAVKETPNLRAQGKLVSYVYNKERLEAILYPDSADVAYVFGDATETGPAHGFVAGRIKRRIDESGQVDFQYDALGNVVKETSALVSLMPSQKGGYQAVMSYSYDSFGRVLEMTFPGTSGEVVRYGYDGGGQVTSARGLDTVVKAPAKSPDTIYLQHIGYDEFGKRTRVVAGNGVETRYAYEADTRRLAQVNSDYRDPFQVTHGQGPLPFQRLRYAYDVVANVRTLQNAVPVDARNGQVRVSPTSFTYDYDRLYQLTHVDGLDQDQNNTRSRHSLDYAYDAIGNISQKNQQDFRDQIGPGGLFQAGALVPGTSYKLDYRYAGPAPHAVSHIDESLPQNRLDSRDFGHDADGNQTGWTFRNGSQRVQAWTEEDRLRSVQDQGHAAGQYLYNAAGARTHNVADGRELVYVNQFVTLRNSGSSFTKHIYAGDTRIASKVDGDAAPKPATFWYHGDQMQSTQYVTADDQSLVEHHEYFASGESWRDEGETQLETVGPDFLFNGKELDPSTGYYYFGARYYDPKVQSWQSTDPVLTSYMRGSRAGGVYQPRNLGLYAYAWNSPAVVRDPDGQAVVRNDSLAKAEKTILAEAQKETDDKISFDKFGILQIDKEATGKLKHPEGTKLLRRLINSPQIVTLTRRTDKGFHHITPADEDKVRHGDPTDSTIQLNVDDDQGLSILVGNGEQKGNRLERKSPFVVSLYHELIHADHYARGVRLVGTQTFSFWNAGGHLEFEDADQGELQAVGLGGLNKAGDVTENQIRQEQGLPLRQAIKGF